MTEIWSHHKHFLGIENVVRIDSVVMQMRAELSQALSKVSILQMDKQGSAKGKENIFQAIKTTGFRYFCNYLGSVDG